MALKLLAAALVLAFASASAARAQDSFTALKFSAAPAISQVAPPLPFRYVGRLVQNGKSEALVMRGNMLYSIAEGDEIDGEYRVERISGATIDFIYLPGRVKQNLDLTAASR